MALNVRVHPHNWSEERLFLAIIPKLYNNHLKERRNVHLGV